MQGEITARLVSVTAMA